jgi:DNA-binding transcriptional LysR family regulator
MTLEQLRIFVAVAERRHVTRASEALRLSQSAVSSAIAALEQAHGVRLFDRVGRGLDLSSAGREFLPEARAVLARATAATRTLDDLADLKRGSIALGASQTIANYWLPPRMARFAEQHPGVALSLLAGNSAQIVEAVLEGRVDLGFVEAQIDHPALAQLIVATDNVGLYVGARHPLAGRAVETATLRTASWVLREPGSGTRSHFEHEMAARDLVARDLKIVLELPSNDAVLAAAGSSELIAAVSALAAAPLVATGRIVELPFVLKPRSFRLIRHADRSPSRAGKTFIDELEDSSICGAMPTAVVAAI